MIKVLLFETSMMRYFVKWYVFFLCGWGGIYAQESHFTGQFKEWAGKRSALLSLVQAGNPVVIGEGAVETTFLPYSLGHSHYLQVKRFLERSGFRPFSHWYTPYSEGTAIFVRNDFFGQGSYAHEKDIDLRQYKLCHVPDLHADFYIDEVPDGIKTCLKKGIYWEGGIGNLIRDQVKPSTVAIDVGAHIGIHTITMSRKVGPLGAVIAFEPQKKIYAEQLYNLRVNQCKNVISIRKAIGEKPGVIQLAERNPINEGGTAFGEGGDTAEMITLDSLHLQNVSLIKIDVERYEYNVFLGAKETIQRNKPVLIFEIMGEHDYNNCSPDIKVQFDQVIDLVKSYDYDVQLIFGNDYIAYPIPNVTQKSTFELQQKTRG